MPERRIATLERLVVHGPGKDSWFIRPGSRSRPWTWFKSWEVPEVDARAAVFELERIRGGWRVLRLVEIKS